MTREREHRVSFRETVYALLKAARSRSRGRARRQQELLRQRRGKQALNLRWLAYPVLLLFGIILHGLFAFSIFLTVQNALNLDAEAGGKIVVGWELPAAMKEVAKMQHASTPAPPNELQIALRKLDEAFSDEGNNHVRGKSSKEREAKIRAQYQKYGAAGFVTEAEFHNPLQEMALPPYRLSRLIGTLMLIWWFLMITFQGEGVDLDVQRRRHPMWEWLLSHPVQPAAVFLAEMISPLAANPNLLLAPIFWIGLFLADGWSFWESLVPGFLIGMPLAVAAACLNKAFEIGAMLRLSPRSRGAVLGVLSWLGFVLSMGIFVPIAVPDVTDTVLAWLLPVARHFSPPILLWMLEGPPGWKGFGFPICAAWGFSLALIGISAWSSAVAARRGLAGGFGDKPTAVKVSRNADAWLKDPLYRKELLWFARDRSAIVQTILIPLSVAGYQIFNMRGLLEEAAGQWSWLCTVAVVFGTYFLFILGPKSLVSEGPALWIALTWPRGMESLLKAKARLWSLLATIPVGLGLGVAVALYPASWWKIALVGVGWWFFGRSLAQKAVTLVQAPDSSGETEPISRGRRYAAWLGMFTFSAGVASQQWYLVVTGVVYSWVTAAAMWQNFRGSLPFLFDPWSERPPRPPTLMHAMIAILAMIEIISVVTAIAIGSGAEQNLWMIRAITYAVVGLLTWLGTRRWLMGCGVTDGEIWWWEGSDDGKRNGLWEKIALGMAAGAALGFCAWLYLDSLHWWWPEAAKGFKKSAEYLAKYPDGRAWLAFTSVICAPLAEEYLFRGLLFRALDREWGGWRALVGSAAFFAIYHPPQAWPLVFSVGLLNAWLFKSSRSLWPGVAAHAAYNLVVILQ